MCECQLPFGNWDDKRIPSRYPSRMNWRDVTDQMN